jgi:hypothetical protein
LAYVARAKSAGTADVTASPSDRPEKLQLKSADVDIYFSADVETDGPIPGPFSMLALALVKAGSFDGTRFSPADLSSEVFYAELQPISEQYEAEALAVNGLDRNRLIREGREPRDVMTEAADWIRSRSTGGSPVLVAYPLSFDWLWLYWYFVRFSRTGSPFNHSRCFDVKTAFAVKHRRPISGSGRNELRRVLGNVERPHTHKAVDDAREQAEIFARLFSWNEKD